MTLRKIDPCIIYVGKNTSPENVTSYNWKSCNNFGIGKSDYTNTANNSSCDMYNICDGYKNIIENTKFTKEVLYLDNYKTANMAGSYYKKSTTEEIPHDYPIELTFKFKFTGTNVSAGILIYNDNFKIYYYSNEIILDMYTYTIHNRMRVRHIDNDVRPGDGKEHTVRAIVQPSKAYLKLYVDGVAASTPISNRAPFSEGIYEGVGRNFYIGYDLCCGLGRYNRTLYNTTFKDITVRTVEYFPVSINGDTYIPHKNMSCSDQDIGSYTISDLSQCEDKCFNNGLCNYFKHDNDSCKLYNTCNLTPLSGKKVHELVNHSDTIKFMENKPDTYNFNRLVNRVQDRTVRLSQNIELSSAKKNELSQTLQNTASDIDTVSNNTKQLIQSIGLSDSNSVSDAQEAIRVMKSNLNTQKALVEEKNDLIAKRDAAIESTTMSVNEKEKYLEDIYKLIDENSSNLEEVNQKLNNNKTKLTSQIEKVDSFNNSMSEAEEDAGVIDSLVSLVRYLISN